MPRSADRSRPDDAIYAQRCLRILRVRVELAADGYALVGPEAAIEVVNEFLWYLTDRNYSPHAVRAYAFDLLHLLRWLSVDGLALEDVSTDAALGYLATCGTTMLPRQQGGNVYSIRNGRNTG